MWHREIAAHLLFPRTLVYKRKEGGGCCNQEEAFRQVVENVRQEIHLQDQNLCSGSQQSVFLCTPNDSYIFAHSPSISLGLSLH